MTLSITRETLLEVIGGTSSGNGKGIASRGVEFDSREVKGGELFVALKGEKTHGHEFLKIAYERGASLFLVESAEVAAGLPEPERGVVTSDSLEAFTKLARWWRSELKTPVLAVTGSVGKTTVKEMAASILLQSGTGAYSLKSFNNHVGVPYSLCRIGREHGWAVIEAGMNHAGELARLSACALPNVALITKIAPAHIEFFKDIHAIADAKFEIVRGLADSGSLILNADDEVLVQAALRHPLSPTQKLLRFGSANECDASISACTSLGMDGITFELKLLGETAKVRMSIPGLHNCLNAAGAALAAKTLIPSLSMAQVIKGLESFKAPLMRLNITEISGSRKIVDDSYNANPASMQSLLSIAAELQQQGTRLGLILGDMRELGPRSEQYHRELGLLVAELKPNFIIGVGDYARLYLEPAKSQGVSAFHAESPELAGQLALKMEFDTLLIKASRGVGLERSVKTILQRAGVPQPEK